MTDWFRSWHGAPTDNKWLVIGKKASVAPGVVSAVMWALLDHASQHDSRGFVGDFDVETYSIFSGFEEASVMAVIAALEDKGVIIDGRMGAWEKRQPKREDSSTSRVTKHRDQKRNASERDETQRNAGETQRNAPEKSREDTDTSEASASSVGAREARPPPAQRATRIPDDFDFDDETWAVGRQEGLSDEQVRRERDKFRDHFASASGERSRKLDWQRTARNWLRKTAETIGHARRPSAVANGPPAGGRLGAVQRAVDRFRASDDDPERGEDVFRRQPH